MNAFVCVCACVCLCMRATSVGRGVEGEELVYIVCVCVLYMHIIHVCEQCVCVGFRVGVGVYRIVRLLILCVRAFLYLYACMGACKHACMYG